MVTAVWLRQYLSGFRYELTDEYAIQGGIERALEAASLEFEREPKLDGAGRADFLVGGVCIEVKRDGSLSALLRQLSRYASHDQVRELLVVTARSVASGVPETIGGKPVVSLVLLGSML